MAASPDAKRSSADEVSEERPRKMQKVRRKLRHVQSRPLEVEAAPQDPVFTQGQLLRSIGAALAIVGFDSATPSALEMFRGCVEEYILSFLHKTSTSMSAGRRTTPTAQDFISALSLTPNTSQALLLKPQLRVPLPGDVSFPVIDPPELDLDQPHDFSALLEQTAVRHAPSYIPVHFPRLPPEHAWKQTAVYPEREHDARRIRERATEEGILAEQALRRLAAAAKTGAKDTAFNGPGRGIVPARTPMKRRRDDVDSEKLFEDMLREVAGTENASEPIEQEEKRSEIPDEPLVVHWEMPGWRKGRR